MSFWLTLVATCSICFVAGMAFTLWLFIGSRDDERNP